MSDFFGGLLDSVRSGGDSISSFFGDNSSIGSAIGRAVGSAYPQNDVTKYSDANSLAKMGNVSANNNYSPTSDRVGPTQSENFARVETEWLRRIQRFAMMDSQQASKVNEGKPQ